MYNKRGHAAHPGHQQWHINHMQRESILRPCILQTLTFVCTMYTSLTCQGGAPSPEFRTLTYGSHGASCCILGTASICARFDRMVKPCCVACSLSHDVHLPRSKSFCPAIPVTVASVPHSNPASNALQHSDVAWCLRCFLNIWKPLLLLPERGFCPPPPLFLWSLA